MGLCARADGSISSRVDETRGGCVVLKCSFCRVNRGCLTCASDGKMYLPMFFGMASYEYTHNLLLRKRPTSDDFKFVVCRVSSDFHSNHTMT